VSNVRMTRHVAAIGSHTSCIHNRTCPIGGIRREKHSV
jgi:hypothetical protein